MPLVTAADYNQLVSGSNEGGINQYAPSLGIVWGMGYGRWGYGQDSNYIAPVVVGEKIFAQDWENINDILNYTSQHQGNTYVPLPNNTFFTGGIITKTPQTTLAAGVNTVYNGAGMVANNSDSTPYVTPYNGYWGDSGNRELVFTQEINFLSADAARYFFNAGGKIKLSFSRTGGDASSRNTFWTNLCAAAGTVAIGYRNTLRLGGNINAPYTALNNNNGGFWANGTNFIEHLRTFATGSDYYGYGYGYYGYNDYYDYYGYNNTNDYIKVDVKVSGPAGDRAGLGNKVTVRTTFKNGTVVVPNSADRIGGTTTVSLVVSSPWTEYITDTWGTYTIPNAVVNL